MTSLRDIPLVKQTPGSRDCLRCCAAMLFQFYRDDITIDEIWNKLHDYQKHSGMRGSHMADLALVALKRDYQVSLYHYEWRWWNQAMVNASQKNSQALIKQLKLFKNKSHKKADKVWATKEINILKAGATIEFKPPTLDHIDKWLMLHIPVIINVQAANLYHNPANEDIHAIMITGKEGNKYLINDPIKGAITFAEQELFYAWAVNDGWMLVIQKQQKKQKVKPKKQLNLGI